VWSDAAAPKLIVWTKLHDERWLVHLTHTMASGYEETYALDLREEGVALGGRALGAAGWLMSLLWLGAALLVAVLVG